MPPIKDEQYLLLPCSGRAHLNIPRGHVFLVKTRDGEELGCLTEQQAYEKYGRDDCYLTGSDTLCPECFDDITKRIEEFHQRNRERKQ